MRIIKDESNCKHVEWSYAEFVDHAEKRKISKKAQHGGAKSSRRKEKRNDWYMSNSIDEALEYARTGWDAGLEQLEITDGLLANSGIELNPTMAGGVVNIGAYLDNDPMNMWQFNEKTDYNLEELVLFVRLNYSAAVSGDTAMVFTKHTLDIVNKLQSKYHLKVVGRFHSRQIKHEYEVDVVIKDFNDRFVINSMAYAFHPSFYRRLYFSHLEGEEFIDCFGYGIPRDTATTQYSLSEEYGKSTIKCLLAPSIEATNGGEYDLEHLRPINFDFNHKDIK